MRGETIFWTWNLSPRNGVRISILTVLLWPGDLCQFVVPDKLAGVEFLNYLEGAWVEFCTETGRAIELPLPLLVIPGGVGHMLTPRNDLHTFG